MGDLVLQVEKAEDVAINGFKNVVPFPFSHMRKVMVGVTRGELLTLGGRPGHAKTSFALAMGVGWLDQGFKVLFISKEMPAFRLIHKIATMKSKTLTGMILRRGELDLEQKAELATVSKKIIQDYQEKLFIIDDKFAVTDVPALVDRIKPDVVIDDYLQITNMNQSDERQELKRITLEMVRVAKANMIAYVSLSQLNRAIEIRDNPYPITSDLAGSDSIGWNSADVLMMHYGHKLNPDKYAKDRIAVIATKTRFGESRAFHFHFDGDHMKFTPLIKSQTAGARR